MDDDVRREDRQIDDVGDEVPLIPEPEDILDSDDIPDILDSDSDDRGPVFGTPVRTVTSGRLTLNPKVDERPLVPLCPACEAPIERWEAPNGAPVEFRCECDGLRYFEFPEREDADQ